jgi:hypothetical protein
MLFLLSGWPVLPVPLLSRLASGAFFAALAFTFYSAVIPPQYALHLVPWDKAEHFIAFYALTGLAAAAFPRRHILLIAVLLSAFGALIEFVQGLPMVHRDRDFWDWVADTLAIGAALSPMMLVWWRRAAITDGVPATSRGVATPGVASPTRGLTTPGVATPAQKNADT